MDDALVVLVFVQQLHDSENGAPFGKNVHSAIGIILNFSRDLSGAADCGSGTLVRENDPEFEPLFQAAADHVLVARLENMQGERHARQENDIEGEKRDSSRSHREMRLCWSPQRREFRVDCISSRACMSPALWATMIPSESSFRASSI